MTLTENFTIFPNSILEKEFVFEVNLGASQAGKTFKEITKLEKNGSFVYESVPGTKVTGFLTEDRKVTFSVEGSDHTQITLDLEEEKEYRVLVDGINLGNMTTNIGGKLVISVELTAGQPQDVVIERI